MATREDVSGRCLVLAAHEARWRDVLRPAVERAVMPDGREVLPVRIDPQRREDLSATETLDLLEHGVAVVADLTDLPPAVFPLLAWHARVRPRGVVLLRHGTDALPFGLHEFPVHPYDCTDPDAATRSRVEIAGLVAACVTARTRRRPGLGNLASPADSMSLRRRRGESGCLGHVLAADRALLAGNATGARAAMESALAAEPRGSDLLLRAAVLDRDAGRWDHAARALDRVLRLEPACPPAWRERGLVRDRGGEGDPEPDLLRAVELADDYHALVALSHLAGRRGDVATALRWIERAGEVSGGQTNLVLPTLLLRAAHARRVDLSPGDRSRVSRVLEIRRRQAAAEPPEDAPWSGFDAAECALLLGRQEEAVAAAGRMKPWVRAAFERDTLARALECLETAGLEVAAVRETLGIRPRTAPAQRTSTEAAPSRPFRARAPSTADYRKNVPCATACPVGTDAGPYVSLTARGEFAEAYRTARGPNPFASVCGRVCAAGCEEACRRGAIDAPVSIRAIKRFLTERHGPEGTDSLVGSVVDGSPTIGFEGEAYASHLRGLATGPGGGRRVAVVGGGPAGLACAHDLALLGHRVTLHEAAERLGGMMRHGIPEYRLPRSVLDAEVDEILKLGVEVKLGEGLSSTRTLAGLREAGAAAVFLASGASRGRDLEVGGSHLDGVVRAIDFLLNVHAQAGHAGFRMDLGRRVVVLGGGSVSIDVARTARLGRAPENRAPEERMAASRALAPDLDTGALQTAVNGWMREVHLVGRSPLPEWPAMKSHHGREEVDEARREGVVLHPLRGIRRILGENGRVTGVELAEVVESAGAASPSFGTHAAEVIPCDSVLLAIGQEPDLDYLEGTAGMERTREGFLRVDRETLSTSLPGVYAGGDAAFGPRTLIEAVAEGKRAARSIHAYLTQGRKLALSATFEHVDPRSVAPRRDYDRLARVEPPVVSVERRTGVAEVEGSYDEKEAVRQASRCLSCHVQTVYDGDRCIACGRCTDVCPYACLSLVPTADVDVVETPASPAGVLMLKDETHCIRCGLCAERCPTGAMTMERFDLRVAVGAA